MNYRTITAFVAGMLLTLALVAPRPVAEAQSQGEMNVTAYADYKKADAELNRVYKKLVATEDVPGLSKLKKAQRAWIAFRDAEMSYAGDEMRGGSAEPLLIYGAGASLTKARIKDLNTYLHTIAEH